jgi:O-antigen/teichoic acid export membrane protein
LSEAGGRPISGLGRQVGWTYLQVASTVVTGLVVTGLALRRLGAADFGVFALVTAISSFLLLLDIGLGFTVVRAAAREASADDEPTVGGAREEVERAHSAYAALGAVALVAVAAFVLLSPVLLPDAPAGRRAAAATTGLIGLGVALAVATSALPGVVTGRRAFHVLALATTAGSALNLAIVAGLVGRLGLVALGLGSLASMAVTRLAVALWLRASVRWFRLWPRRLGAADLRGTVHVALPLLLLAVSGQVISTSDLVILGWLRSGAVVGLYRLGSSLPTQAGAVLYQGYDVVLPSFAATADRAVQEHALRFLTRVASYAGAVGLGTMALLRRDLVLVVAGGRSPLAASVLLVFCAIWLITLGPHGLGLLLIARGRERALLPLLLAEMGVNLALTVVLVHLVGPLGAAYATMVTLVLSSVVLLPAIARRELSLPVWRLLGVDGAGAMACGLVVAVLAWLVVRGVTPHIARVVAGGGVAAAAGLAAGVTLLGRQGRRDLAALLRRLPPPAPAPAPAAAVDR